MFKRIFLFSLCGFTLLHSAFAETLFNTSFENDIITVSTKTRNFLYQNAGIRILTPDYSISGNTLAPGNGYFLFSVSDTQSANFSMTGASGEFVVQLCLNGTGSTYGCENHTFTMPDTPSLATYNSSTGAAVGTRLVPGLGLAGSTTVHFYGLPLLSPGVCNTSITNSSFPGIAVTLTETSLTSPPSFPDPCVAICHNSITSSTYPGRSLRCTNVLLVT